MKPYRTLATVRLFTGEIGLTDNQVKWRAGCLSKIRDDVYEITAPVTFKAGEVIGLEEVPKPYRKVVECLEPKTKTVVERPVVSDDIKAELEKPAPKKRGKKPAKAKA